MGTYYEHDTRGTIARGDALVPPTAPSIGQASPSRSPISDLSATSTPLRARVEYIWRGRKDDPSQDQTDPNAIPSNATPSNTTWLHIYTSGWDTEGPARDVDPTIFASITHQEEELFRYSENMLPERLEEETPAEWADRVGGILGFEVDDAIGGDVATFAELDNDITESMSRRDRDGGIPVGLDAPFELQHITLPNNDGWSTTVSDPTPGQSESRSSVDDRGVSITFNHQRIYLRPGEEVTIKIFPSSPIPSEADNEVNSSEQNEEGAGYNWNLDMLYKKQALRRRQRGERGERDVQPTDGDFSGYTSGRNARITV